MGISKCQGQQPHSSRPTQPIGAGDHAFSISHPAGHRLLFVEIWKMTQKPETEQEKFSAWPCCCHRSPFWEVVFYWKEHPPAHYLVSFSLFYKISSAFPGLYKALHLAKFKEDFCFSEKRQTVQIAISVYFAPSVTEAAPPPSSKCWLSPVPSPEPH